MRGRALGRGCVVWGKNFPDISNIKKIWGVLVMARFVPGNLIEGAPFSEVIPRARPPGRGEHVVEYLG